MFNDENLKIDIFIDLSSTYSVAQEVFVLQRNHSRQQHDFDGGGRWCERVGDADQYCCYERLRPHNRQSTWRSLYYCIRENEN